MFTKLKEKNSFTDFSQYIFCLFKKTLSKTYLISYCSTQRFSDYLHSKTDKIDLEKQSTKIFKFTNKILVVSFLNTAIIFLSSKAYFYCLTRIEHTQFNFTSSCQKFLKSQSYINRDSYKSYQDLHSINSCCLKHYVCAQFYLGRANPPIFSDFNLLTKNPENLESIG